MNFNPAIVIFSFLMIGACSDKTLNSTANSESNLSPAKTNIYWKEVNESIKSSLVCKGKVMPLKYSIYETNYSDLRKLLLRKSDSKSAVNLDTTFLTVPVPNGNSEEFAITRVQVLPPELSEKYQDIKTYQGKSTLYPEDNIRLDIAPKGISYMIMSTRGTIIMDPFCNDDSTHVIIYFKSDLPEGVKQDFEK